MNMIGVLAPSSVAIELDSPVVAGDYVGSGRRALGHWVAPHPTGGSAIVPGPDTSCYASRCRQDGAKMLLAKAMVTSGLLLALFAGCGSNMSAESSADSGVVDAGNTAGTADAGADAEI